MALATAEYLTRFKKGVTKRLKMKGGMLTENDINAAHKEARAGAGGASRAARFTKVKAADGTDVLVRLDDDDEDEEAEMLGVDELSELEAEGSFEDAIEDIAHALKDLYGRSYGVVATFTDHVIYVDWNYSTGGEPQYWSQAYSGNDDDGYKWGPRIQVEKATTFQPVKAENGKHVYSVELADPLGTKARSIYIYTRNSTIEIPDEDDPEEEPNAEPIAFELHDDRRAQLSDEAPLDGVRTLVSLRLADTPGTNGTIPEWQQYHKIGECAIEHGVAGKIALTRKMGDNMIRNFNKNVLRKPLTLDENHNNAGPALARAVKLQWGNEGDGLPGKPEPKGKGDILFVKWKYTPSGEKKLTDGDYYNQSPQYEYDYYDKESGNHYGVTATGCAATNNPFLRLQTWQGEAAGAPVLLTDAAPAHKEIATVAAPNGQTQTQTVSLEEWNKTQATIAQLLERDAQREIELNEIKATNAQLVGTDRGMAVKTLLDDRTRKGLDPAIAKLARPILLACDPAEAPDKRPVQLSDAEGAQPVNMYDAITALVNAIPLRPVDTAPRTTVNGDMRPHTNGAELQDEAAIKLQDETAKRYWDALDSAGSGSGDGLTPTQRASRAAVATT